MDGWKMKNYPGNQMAYYYMRKQKRLRVTEWWSYLLSPLIGVGFISFMWISLDIKSMILGILWSLVGLIYLLYLVKIKGARLDLMKFEE